MGRHYLLTSSLNDLHNAGDVVSACQPDCYSSGARARCLLRGAGPRARARRLSRARASPVRWRVKLGPARHAVPVDDGRALQVQVFR